MQPAPCFKLHHRYLLVSEIPLEDLKNVPYFGDSIKVDLVDLVDLLDLVDSF